jgi:hypothetical protein
LSHSHLLPPPRRQYLAFLLGWQAPPAGAFHKNANPHPHEPPPSLRPRLDALLESDSIVYRRVLAQLDAQAEVLARRRGGALAAWAKAGALWLGGAR